MKKFTRILICLMLCVLTFGFVACDTRTEEEKNFTYPSSNDYVYGNGGLAVKKGNYVYFVNGYQSVENISSKRATYTVGSLMLMKLGENGEVVTNKEGLVDDDYYITMNNKLCGYEATNLYIHDDYLYFATPCLENESGDETWAKERVVFSRIKLDKTGKVEEVYSADVKYDQLEYQYYEQEDGDLYILVWEKGESYYDDKGSNVLVRVNATNKTSTKISTDVTGVIFAKEADEIFFAKHSSSDELYSLKQFNIVENEVTNYYNFEKSFEPKFVANGCVYVTIAHDYGTSTDIQMSVIANKSGFETVYSYTDAVELNVTSDGNVLLISSNKISIVTDIDETVDIVDEDATEINVVDFTNGCILYYNTTSENSNIKLVSYNNALYGGDASIKTLATIAKVEEDYAYFDYNDGENNLYFYQKTGENYYLNRIKVNNNLEETFEMFGEYLEGDIPVVEEEVEEEEE